ncbi:helicase-exonuclease AddAB subunit AddA [Amphibacillus cookii]|uniref:helicase-exonuclease AddAB subunit AddA n=1 Tax=Amphibacillus cookii TaxID=767787 RepID=UPI001959CAE7|nr:helicase-exonuclease AddAB subunit AddA [Amphibacillus cookii]MBM7541487.1 ATP-dependent helicase/nuclease subunit A [Amphibacillus cookii]
MAKWTEAQSQAIHISGKDTLVAAAAGSGKTAVLVERIIQKILNQKEPINIDQLLVVTFTNAAAQEMRHRISQALEQALEERPDSAQLKQQLTLLQQASISTLHSFCLDLIKRYSYLLDIDPGFRIADPIEADLLRQEVLESLFEEWYGKSFEEQEAFFQVIDRFSNDRSDQEVETLILKLYDFAIQNPWPDRWLDEIADQYDLATDVKEEQLEWLTILKDSVDQQLQAAEADIDHALEITREADGPYHYAEALELDFNTIQTLKAKLKLGWDQTQQTFQSLTFKALSRKKVDGDERKKEQVKVMRNRVKKRLTDIKEQLFTRSLETYLTDVRGLYPTIKQLIGLVKQFKAEYQQLKKEKGLIDFSDLEHYALTVLIDDDARLEVIEPSNIAKTIRAKFTEVLIDEYQDTNMVQETILTLVTKESPGNLFMVGDVKQSIYRFRHAEPSLFINKYKKFAQDHHLGHRIDLAKNFRSRKEILTATNYIFKQLLDERVGEINYDQDAELIYGNLSYDEANQEDVEAELMIIDRSNQSVPTANDEEMESNEDLAKAEIEGRAYAKRIKQWIGMDGEKPKLIFDKEMGISRPTAYRDIVILLRSMTWAPAIMDELKKQGIPVYAELATGYLEAIEIQVMLSLLKVIDNAKQDIALASVLKSPLVGIDEEALAQIRLTDKKATYYEALQTFLTTLEAGRLKQKLIGFLSKLSKWRSLARQGSLSDLIWQIYRETGYYDFVAGMPGGRQRQANLRALYDRARGYEQTSFRGLFRFLRMIERMEERGEDLGAARALGEQEDVVRITTIHKSKGLEYPIVILGAMDKPFNMQDLRQRYLLHKDLGFGSKFIDPINRIMYPTLIYHGIKQYIQKELWAEEMRVLYVALTRAKEKLVMVGTVNAFEKKQEKWLEALEHKEWTLPGALRLGLNTYMDWVGVSLIRHRHADLLRGERQTQDIPLPIWEDQSQWKITVSHVQDYQDPVRDEQQSTIDLETTIAQAKSIKHTSKEHDEKVHDRLEFQYAYQEATRHRAKQTVTEIKRQQEQVDENAATDIIRSFRPPIVERPLFMQQNRQISVTELGTVTHTVMQHLPFRQDWDQQRIEGYINQLVNKEILTSVQAQAIDKLAIARFFDTALFNRIKQAKVIEREVPFSLMIPAHEIYQGWDQRKQEDLFVQGIIDLLIETENGWIIIDYKTDRIPDYANQQERDKMLTSRYQTQLDLYTRAIETVLNITIKERYLYFFEQALVLQL